MKKTQKTATIPRKASATASHSSASNSHNLALDFFRRARHGRRLKAKGDASQRQRDGRFARGSRPGVNWQAAPSQRLSPCRPALLRPPSEPPDNVVAMPLPNDEPAALQLFRAEQFHQSRAELARVQSPRPRGSAGPDPAIARAGQIPRDRELESRRIFRDPGGRDQATDRERDERRRAGRDEPDGNLQRHPAGRARDGGDPICSLERRAGAAPEAEQHPHPQQRRPEHETRGLGAPLFSAGSFPDAHAAGGGCEPSFSAAPEQEPQPAR